MGQKRRRHKNVAGFTLLEALIAMALMAMILTALATVTAQWLPNWNRGMVQVQRNEQVALGLERMIADLGAAEFIPANRKTRQPLFDGTGRSVTFVRIAVGPDTGSGLEIVRLAEDNDAREPVLVRTRAPFEPSTTDAIRRDQPNFTDPVVLLRAPYRLSFSYAGADRIWRETWRQQLDLPQAVKLTLRDTTTQQTLAVSTATALHVELPAECITAKSIGDCFATQPEPSEPANGKSR